MSSSTSYSMPSFNRRALSGLLRTTGDQPADEAEGGTPIGGKGRNVIWLRDWSRRADVKVRVLCLPPAGGGAHVYRRWPDRLPSHVGVVAVELPGHGSRMAEPPVTSLDELVRGLRDEVESLLDTPMVVFGHSMGAIVGFELCRVIRRGRDWRPAGFVAAGCDAPDTLVRKEYAGRMTDAGIARFLRDMGGTPAAILGNEKYLAMLRPVIRADLMVLAGRLPVAERPLGCPVRVYLGSEDRTMTTEAACGWAPESAGNFAIHTFPGSHFFVQESEELVLDRLQHDIREWLRGPSTAQPPPDYRIGAPESSAPSLL
jgi:surfactin synthase thioesterase subunit